MRSVVPMRIAKIGYIVISVVLVLAGVGMIIFPEISAASIERFLGITMIVFGGVKLVGYFSKDLFRLAFEYDLQFGILLLIIGSIALIRPEHILNFTCVATGICILADGLFKIRISRDSKLFGIKTWWIILALAILTCAVGLLLLIRPAESVMLLTVFFGIALIASGIMNLYVVLSVVKIVKNQLSEENETVYTDRSEDSGIKWFWKKK